MTIFGDLASFQISPWYGDCSNCQHRKECKRVPSQCHEFAKRDKMKNDLSLFIFGCCMVAEAIIIIIVLFGG